MKILFLRHPMKAVGGTGAYTVELVRQLLQQGHEVGLWPVEGSVFLSELYEMGVIGYDMEAKGLEAEWDLAVIQNIFVYTHGQAILARLGDLPHVFISHSSGFGDQVLLYPELYKVFTIAEGLVRIHARWGIPEELVEVIRNPIQMAPYPMRATIYEPYHLLLVSRLSNDRFENIRQIISAVNRMPNCRLTIVGGGAPSLLQDMANDHIHMLGQKRDPHPYFADSDLVIGSGRAAVEGVLTGRPTVIAGARGFAGLVTPDNFHSLKQRMFAGRDGGDLNEMMPPEKIIQAILEALQRPDLDAILAENQILARSEYDPEVIRTKVVAQFEKTVALGRHLRDDALMLGLRPKVASNCGLLPMADGSGFFLVRQPNETRVREMNPAFARFFNGLNGVRTIAEIIEAEGSAPFADTAELLASIRNDWKLKTVVFPMAHA